MACHRIVSIATRLVLVLAVYSATSSSAGNSDYEARGNTPLRPAFQPTFDKPGLPRVLLIGDSVSIGYTVRVREALKGKANVHRPPTNCGSSAVGLAGIEKWLGDGRWDVIHFNFGLHDIRRVESGMLNVPPESYETNLRAIVARLKKTGAKLIWATTTPVPATNRPGQFPRLASDVIKYNDLAGQIVGEHAILTNDLYSAVLPQIKTVQAPGDVHFSANGYAFLAERVTRAIGAVLPTNSLDLQTVHVAQVETRIWSCDFTSVALGKPMRFLVVKPADMETEESPRSVIYFLHGSGRNEHTLLDYATRDRILNSSCVVVLPRGDKGWYMNSPEVDANRYADYLDEVISLSERYFPFISREAAHRGIGGWSMGGYGALYTACRRPKDFAAAASIIGIIDIPKPDASAQHYQAMGRFGNDEGKWPQLNPRRMIANLKDTRVFVAYAEDASERQMNESFIVDAQKLNIEIQTLRLSGGHKFPVVEKALPATLDFLEKSLGNANHSP